MLDLKQIYLDGFKDKRYASNQARCDEVLEEWIQYRNKIIDDTFTIDDYTNDISNGNYLANFLEKTSSCFGKSSVAGTASRAMVKKNAGKNSYSLLGVDGYNAMDEADRTQAVAYFDANIKPLFKKIVEASTLEDLRAIENSKLYKQYIAKQLLEKAIVLESKVKDCDFKYKMLEIYDHAGIDFIYKKLLELSGASCETEKCYRSSLKLFEILEIDENSLTEKDIFEVSKMVWDIYHNHGKYFGNIDKIKEDPIGCVILNVLESNHKQLVLTGAPGTGKTYGASKFVDDYIDPGLGLREFVQFHPSYDYSDFVEGLRPVILEDSTENKPTFVKLDGIFKEFCRNVVMRNYEQMVDSHPDEEDDFFELYPKHEDEIQTKHFFIIDEINRADLSKVFGELMFGLEESYRGISFLFSTQYGNLETYKINDNGKAEKMDFDCFKNGFFIPHNVNIIGTMNDIDRSVEAFDFALRRRFEWIEIKANNVVRKSLESMGYQKKQSKKLAEAIVRMNNVISLEGRQFGLSEAYHIGHAYFSDVDFANYGQSLAEVFENNISPIIKEYTRGRNQNDVLVFIENCKNALLSE